MSNLSRKVIKNTEPFSEQRKRSQRKFKRRIAAGTIRSAFKTPHEYRLEALSHLGEDTLSLYENDLGVVDMDEFKFTYSTRWSSGVGWYPHWSVELPERTPNNVA